MRTTIKIDDDLLSEAKARAARAGTTLNAVVEDALRSAFNRGSAAPAEEVRLPTFAGGHVQPGVDLADSAALLERMEEAVS